ncbi:MAG TPA: sulfotransferase family 2 domain-containing protein [Rhizomicrobium sp.]|nr:sulfotransferase family 2 domain-containing protein [Rhizomicrobium sp.]
MQSLSIVFLHIPKTAGQSVHHFLKSLVEPAAVAPARVNEQLYLLSVPELRGYRLFSGHLDWSLLDCVQPPRFVFTILRDPVERILSFYFFLRSEAQKLSEEELNRPENQGKHAVLHLSCDEYFTGGKPHIRTFLDNHYDNFYMYFFAGRTYDARQRLLARQAADKSFTTERILQMAFDNLALLDGVYTIDRLDCLERDLRFATGFRGERPNLAVLHINRGASDPAGRMKALAALGATEATFDRIRAMVAQDEEIWKHYSARQ